MKSFTFDEKKTLKGKFKPSTVAERNFFKALKRVAQASGHIVEAHIDGHKLVDEKKMMDALKRYSNTIEPWAIRQSRKLLEQVQNSNKRAYRAKSNAIAKELKTMGDSEVGQVALKLLNEQVALIKSIPEEAGLRAQKIAYDSFLHGTRATPDEQTIKAIQDQLGLTTEQAVNRAKLIAITETARANAAINQARAQAVGSNQYRWHNSGDEAVRHSHKFYRGKKMQGQIFSWDNPPTLDDGTKGHPGTFPRCRCFAEPVFDDE